MDKYYNDIGLFRFSLIAPVINDTHGYKTKEEYFRETAAKKHIFNGHEVKVTANCLRSWYQKYKKYGITKLQKHERNDKRTSRKLTAEMIVRILELREEYPYITGVKIYQKLVEEKYFSKKDISQDTILRYLRMNSLKASQTTTIERRMFEMEHVNDCWQSDTSDGPYIEIGGKKYRTKLIMFIDDKSRMIVGYDFFLTDTAINMQSVFKKAILTYGKPKKLFVDNGGPYDNKQLSYICASLGIELIHAKPYSPESKAKIERSFRTIKDGWMRCTDWNEFKSLEDVKKSMSEFIYNEYNNKIHSSTKMSPNTRWHNEYEIVQILDEESVNKAFLHRKERKVRNDRTIKLENSYYEVPFKYVGKTIEIRYEPNHIEELFIYEKEEQKETIKKVDIIANAKIKRKNNIDYSKAINDERNVIEMEGK